MEQEPKKNARKQEKKNMAILKMGAGAGAGGFGIGGIVLLGGALVTATLVSAFVIKARSQRRPSTHDKNRQQPPPPATTDRPENFELMMKSSKDYEASKGLSLLSHDSSPPILHHNPSSDGTTKMGVILIEPAPILILDEKPKLEINGGKVDLTNGDEEEFSFPVFDNGPPEIQKEPESTPLFDDSGTITEEEFSSPVFDSPSLPMPEKVMEEAALEETEEQKNEEEICKAGHTAVEDDEAGCRDQVAVEEGEEICYDYVREIVIETVVRRAHADQVTEEEDLQITLSEEQERENDHGEIIAENCAEESTDNHIKVEDIPEMELIEGYGDDNGEAVVEKSEKSVQMADADQVAVEDDRQIHPSEVQETFSNGDKENFCCDRSIWVQGLLSEPENANRNDSITAILSSEAVDVVNEDDAIETACADQIKVEDDPSMQMIVKKEKGDEAVETAQAEIFAEDETPQMQPSEAEGSDEVVDITHEDEKEENLPMQMFEKEEKGEEAVETVQAEIAVADETPQTQSSEVEGSDEVVNIMNEDEKEENPPMQMIEKEEKCEEAVGTVQVDMAVEEKILQMQLSEERSDEVVDIMNEDEKEDKPPMQMIKTVEEAVEAVRVKMAADDETPQMQSSEEEEERNNEDITEKAEDSSEETGESSMKSNAEEIWPEESMQELSPEFNNQNKGDNIVEDRTIDGEENSNIVHGSDDEIDEDKGSMAMSFGQRYITELAKQSKQPPNEPWKLRIWTGSMLVPLWCLCQWYFGLPFLKLCLISIFTLIVILLVFPKPMY